jgi:hypothetical protein
MLLVLPDQTILTGAKKFMNPSLSLDHTTERSDKKHDVLQT